MPLFISSITTANRHAVYAIERNPPAVVQAVGTGVAALVEQFPWGPEQILTEPTSIGDMLNTFCPPGMSRLSVGYLTLIRKAFPTLKIVRVTHTADSVKATATVPKAGPANMLTLTLKYPGAAGNSVTATVATATDGDTNHFNLSVTVTGASGTTTDLLQNLNYSGVGSDSAPDFTSLLLLGAITKLSAGLPTPGTYAFSTGADGTIVAADYVGTQGTGDKGMALFESDDTIRHVFTGDPGNSLRAAVNAGLEAHAGFMGDRVAYINGNSGQSLSAVQTDVSTYRSVRVVYGDPWVFILDDVTGARQLVPPSPFIASVASQLSPSTSPAWKSAEATSLLNGVTALETDRGQGAGSNTSAGIATIIREPRGGFSIEAGVVTIAPSDPTKKRLTRTRMGDFIAASITTSIRGFVDAPNVQLNQQNIVNAIDAFMDGLKRAANIDANHTPYVIDYKIESLAGANSPTDLANGDFTVPLDVRTGAGQERIFLSMKFGEQVTVSST